MSAELRATGMTIRFGGVTAVNGLRIEVVPGRIVGLIGPNGAGKSTVINGLTGFYPCAGKLEFERDGKIVDLASLSTRRRAMLGIIRTFQTPRLIPELTVAENVALGTVGGDLAGRWFEALGGPALSRGTRKRIAAAEDTLDALGIHHLSGSATNELSLGEQRLVEIARSKVSDAQIMLFDEPFAGLSSVEQDRLSMEIAELRALGIAILLVEHHLDHVRRLADVVVAMDQGTEFARGAADDVLDSESVRERYLGEVLS